eukprot:gene2470-66019_t
MTPSRAAVCVIAALRAPAAGAAPVVGWVSSPVLPGETLLASGEGLGGADATLCYNSTRGREVCR